VSAPDLFSFLSPGYPTTPGWKKRDTSIEAAVSIAARAPKLRDRVLATIKASGHHGLTADQVAARLGISILSARPRLSELVDLKLIRDTGHRRRNDSGKNAIVWQAT